MPLNPLENMPVSLTRHNIALNRYIENINELKINEQPVKFASCENLENTSGLPHTSPSTYHVSNLLQQAKVSSPRNLNSIVCLSYLVNFESIKVLDRLSKNFFYAERLKELFCILN